MKKLSAAQRKAIGILISGDDARITRSKDMGNSFACWTYDITDGGDILRLHYLVFEWLMNNLLITTGNLMSVDSNVYAHYPTEKLFEIAKEHDVKPYSEYEQDR